MLLKRLLKRLKLLKNKMNHYYHYQYLNGLQFVSLANPIMLTCSFHEGSEKPKLLGVWKFKKLTNKNK